MQPLPTPPDPQDVRVRFGGLYDDLVRVAERMLRDRPGSLAPGDLVHEAFVELQREERSREAAQRSRLAAKPDAAFKACFGAACRDVLADRTRRRDAQKRGGGQPPAPLGSSIECPGFGPVDFASVHDALATLTALDARIARVVEARVFGGLSVAECAEHLQLSPRSVDRHWQFAKAWLRERLL